MRRHFDESIIDLINLYVRIFHLRFERDEMDYHQLAMIKCNTNISILYVKKLSSDGNELRLNELSTLRFPQLLLL